MPQNVVVCCDGTANEFAKDRTNVVKLFWTLIKDPTVQACYYHPGVGTMAAPGFVTKASAKTAEIAGMALGYGITNDICDAYIFLCRNFKPGDQLYLFGFSRGAYTVRALASLLHMYGLIPPDNDRLAPYAVRMMWAIHKLQKLPQYSDAVKARISGYFCLSNEFKATYSRECKPHFVGVWDTVSSVGWVASPLSLPFTASNPDIAIGRHAIAIDERRAFFRTNRWVPSANALEAGPKDLKQVWFPGVHCDVGGGYPEPESGLSKITLQWMIDEARIAGLQLDEALVARVLGRFGGGYVPPDPDGMMHNSLEGWWHLAEYVPKPRWEDGRRTWRCNRSRRRPWPPQPWVHDCAWVRDQGAYSACLPKDAVPLSVAERALLDAREQNATSPPAQTGSGLGAGVSDSTKPANL
jgi:uncharacterized protein (DUF2235 family)